MENKKDCPMCKVSDDVLKNIKGDDFDNGEKKEEIDKYKKKSGFIAKLKKIFL
ncbi:MAG: hypothetical protein AAB397_00600 [Patescibacteria group bacterium]